MTATEQFLKKHPDVGESVLRLSLPKTDEGKKFILEIFEWTKAKQPDGRILEVPTAPYNTAACTFVPRRFKHGYRQLQRKDIYHPIYEVPISQYTVALVQHAWPGNKIIAEGAQKYFRDILVREALSERNAQRYAEFKERGVVPTSDWFDKHNEKLKAKGVSLNPYQRTAAFNACVSKYYGLFMDPGTGKTCIMITKLDYIIEHSNRPTFTVIACPKNVRTNWKNELHKFSVNEDKIFVYELQGANSTDRYVNFFNAVSSDEATGKHIVLITGYESFVQTPDLIDILEFDLCLFDESQHLANPQTKRTKTFLESRPKFHNVIIATGTPFRNSPFDSYSQLEFLCPGLSDHTSFADFKQFYGLYSPSYNGKAILESYQNLPLMQEKLARHTFIIRKHEALPHLPKKTFSILECQLSKEQLRVYLQLSNQFAAQIDSFDGTEDAVTVNNMLTQLLRLAQITSGFVTTDLGAINRFDPNPKLDLLVRYLLGSKDDDEDDLPGCLNGKNKAIVWTCFRQNIATIRARLELEGLKCVVYHGDLDRNERDIAVSQFNCDRDTKVLIGTAASGGVGLNLVGFDPYNANAYDTNCTDVLYFSSNWSHDKRTQSMERAHRYNTRVPVHVTDLLVPNSIDTEIYDKLERKKDMDLSLQDVKNILRNILSKMPSAA